VSEQYSRPDRVAELSEVSAVGEHRRDNAAFLQKENQAMNIQRKVMVAAAGVLSLLGIGVGTAVAQSTTTPPAAVTTADPTAAETPGAPEVPEGAETPGVEEPGDASLPGGGHADPPGNVDHQFEGVE
jgi:hypothetical protein